MWMGGVGAHPLGWGRRGRVQNKTVRGGQRTRPPVLLLPLGVPPTPVPPRLRLLLKVWVGRRPKKSLFNRPQISGPFDKFHFLSQEKFSDVGGWVGRRGAGQGPKPPPPWGPKAIACPCSTHSLSRGSDMWRPLGGAGLTHACAPAGGCGVWPGNVGGKALHVACPLRRCLSSAAVTVAHFCLGKDKPDGLWYTHKSRRGGRTPTWYDPMEIVPTRLLFPMGGLDRSTDLTGYNIHMEFYNGGAFPALGARIALEDFVEKEPEDFWHDCAAVQVLRSAFSSGCLVFRP